MKKILIILVVIIVCSCESTDEKKEFGMYVATSIDFSVFNAQNEDLLNPENLNHLDVSKIKLFYVTNGITKEYYNSNLDSPRNFKIFKGKDEFLIRIYLNDLDNSDKAITYIQWSETDRDTIEATFERAYNILRTKKIWLNGDFVWEEKGISDSPYFKLIK